MSGFLLHVGATIVCPHMGQVQPITSNSKVLVNGQPVVTASDTFTIVGCPNFDALVYDPCILVIWIVPASRVFVNHQPVILQDSTGICQSALQIPKGPPNVIQEQMRVKGI